MKEKGAWKVLPDNMASTKVKGIVIEAKDSKEKDKLATLYTLEGGKLFVVFRGVRSSKAKLKAAKEIFTFAEFVVEETKAGNIVTDANIIDSFSPLRQDLDKYYESCSCLDILKKLSNSTADPALFIEIIKTLKAISYDGAPKNYALVKLLITIFENMGYKLNFDTCSSCKAKLTGRRYLNLDYGEIVCANCRQMTAIEVAPETISALKILSATPYEKLKTVKLGGHGEMKALNLLAENFEWRFGSKFFMV